MREHSPRREIWPRRDEAIGLTTPDSVLATIAAECGLLW
jgi:hypothetical protein